MEKEEKYLLEMRKITKSFPGVLALDNVDFKLGKQSVHAIVGQNGAGKSTLMNVLSGTIKRDSGEILINGKMAKLDTITDAIREGIEYMQQEISIIPERTIAENIFIGNLPFKNLRIDYKKMYQESERILERMGIKIDPKRLVGGLGIGEKQIIMIARLLQRESKIIMMDEPTSSLDSKEVEKLFEVIRTLISSDHSIIYISHCIDEVFKISDHLTVLRNGKEVVSDITQNLKKEEVIEHMLGYKEKNKKFNINKKIGNVVFEVKNLNRPKVLKNISLKIREGEVVGIAGPLGSRRTELLRAIFGVDPSFSDGILINGKQVKIKSPVDAVKLGLSLLTEQRYQGIIPLFPVKSNITLSNLKGISGIFGINFKKEEKIADHYIELLNIMASSSSQIIVNLSGGNQQKVVFSKWLNSEAKILLLDEPTKGIDVGAKLEILNVILNLARKGLAIILVSSEFTDLVNVCNRILIMKKGEIIRELEEVSSDSYLQSIVNE